MRDGIVPGSLHIPRTVLEWRLAPGGAWRNPFIRGPEQQLILICDHGCSTILAAATLVDLGYARAGDVIGGFEAWREAGPAEDRRPDARARPRRAARHVPAGRLAASLRLRRSAALGGAPLDELVQLGGDRVVERRRLELGEHLLPDLVRALRRIA